MYIQPPPIPYEPNMKLVHFLDSLGMQGLLHRYGQPHPLSCLPFPLFQNAVNEISYRVQTPYWMATATTLAAVATSTQSQIKVRIPSSIGSTKSPTLIIYVVAPSGEGKSPAENMAFKSIRDFVRKQSIEYSARESEWKIKNALWQDEVSGLRQLKRRLIRNAEPADDIDAKLAALLKDQPTKPTKVKLIYEDATGAACFHSLSTGFPSAILMSSEGSITINSKAFSDLGKINALYSNDTVTVDRMNGNSYELSALLSVLIMLQPGIHDKMMRKRGDEARSSGFFGRALVFEGESVQGSRIVNTQTTPTEHTDKFNERISALLHNMLNGFNDQQFTPKEIGFTLDASNRLIQIKNLLHAQINNGGLYQDASDHVAKLHENIARVAALLHHFEGLPGDISRETIDGATTICLYSSLSFLKLFCPANELETDTEILRQWLMERRNYQYRYINTTRLYRFGPSSMRKKARMDAALDCLHRQGMINLVTVGYSNKVLVDLLPHNPAINVNLPGVTIW